MHIEQGPVLEWIGFPLGVVKGIAGQTRLKVFEFQLYMNELVSLAQCNRKICHSLIYFCIFQTYWKSMIIILSHHILD